MDGRMEHSYSKAFNPVQHELFSCESCFTTLIKGQFLQIRGHARPQLVQDCLANDSCSPLVILPLSQKEAPIFLTCVHINFWTRPVLHLGCRSGSRNCLDWNWMCSLNMESHELESLSDCCHFCRRDKVAIWGVAMNRGRRCHFDKAPYCAVENLKGSLCLCRQSPT